MFGRFGQVVCNGEVYTPAMVHCEIEYQGNLRTQATHGPSGDSLLTDAPADNRGKGEAFSPTDLLGTALGTCVLTLMGIRAQDRGRDIPGARVSVEKKMGAEPMRHIAKLGVQVTVPGEWSAEERAALEEAARGCPVKASLHERVRVELSFHWKN